MGNGPSSKRSKQKNLAALVILASFLFVGFNNCKGFQSQGFSDSTTGKSVSTNSNSNSNDNSQSSVSSTATTIPNVTSTTMAPSLTLSADHHPVEYSVLEFSDEFSGSELDRSKWCTRYVYGNGPQLQIPDKSCQGPLGGEGTLDHLNDEQQRFVDFNQLGETMHVVSNGTLKLRATKTRKDPYAFFESAMIRSRLEFKPNMKTSYYLTARMKLPNVKGSWPAFWLNPGFNPDGTTAWPPEIDLMEGALNEKDDTAFMIRQGSQVRGLQTASRKIEVTYSLPSTQFDLQWMNFHRATTLRGVWVEIALEWKNESLCYFVDGLKTVCENYKWVDNDGVPAPPAHILLNLAMGGSWAGRYGLAPDNQFPTQFEIDHVRLYKLQN